MNIPPPLPINALVTALYVNEAIAINAVGLVVKIQPPGHENLKNGAYSFFAWPLPKRQVVEEWVIPGCSSNTHRLLHIRINRFCLILVLYWKESVPRLQGAIVTFNFQCDLGSVTKLIVSKKKFLASTVMKTDFKRLNYYVYTSISYFFKHRKRFLCRGAWEDLNLDDRLQCLNKVQTNKLSHTWRKSWVNSRGAPVYFQREVDMSWMSWNQPLLTFPLQLCTQGLPCTKKAERVS